MDSKSQERYAQILLSKNLINESQLAEAVEEQKASGQSLPRVLLEKNLLSEQQLTAILAEQIGARYLELGQFPVDPEVTNLVDASFARRHKVVPVGHEDGKILVAMVDPTNVFALDDIRILSGSEVIPVVSASEDINNVIDRYVRDTMEAEGTLDEFHDAVVEEAEETIRDLTEAAEDAPIVKYVNLLVTEAMNERASDIHIEPGERDVRVRYRIDGVLHEIRRTPRKALPGLVSRIKILAQMNIAERRVPQDGRFKMEVNGAMADIRVATLPTVYGEKTVLRVLDRSAISISLPDLGLEKHIMEQFVESYSKPYGTVIVSGPTGSGKTTTLYAALRELNRREVNIITVEDPVEYQLNGVNQVMVNAKVGLTFAATLRSILRCDPDVVMIGEIRDSESAMMAIESALTGHLVLCTLHTNDAPSAVTRLTEMGVEPFLVASAVDSVVSQRLARRLCPRCKERAEYDASYLVGLGFPETDSSRIEVYKAKDGGCPFCNNTGFRGRVGLYEILVLDEELDRMVVSMATAGEIARKAQMKGMTTLRQDGFSKVLQGVTSIEEVLRVVM